MRPRNLRLGGFTCYSDPVAIDFAGMDLFVVSGPTGAGKSTIVDAICYALYGRVPRSDGTSGLISHNRDEMYVHLEFEAGGERYRLMRTLNRRRKTAKDGSERTTRLPSTVVLEHWEGGEWEPIAGRVREIDDRIEEILGLDFNGFTRCIVLPQGQFQEFLAGDGVKRRELLVELLDIAVYGRIMTAANARASGLAKEADAIDRRLLEDYADATPEALAETRRQREAAGPALETATRRRDALNTAVELAGTVATERARQRDLSADADTARKELAGAQRVSKDGEAQLKALRAEHAAAEEALKAIAYDRVLHQRLGVALTHADAIERLKKQLGDASAVARDETKLAAANATIADAERERTDADVAVAAARERLDAAQRADAAAHVREGLRPGDTCPVCGGVIGTLPKPRAGDGLGAAKKALADAEQRSRRAADALTAATKTVERERQRLDAAAKDAARIEAEAEAVRETLRGLLPDTVAPERPTIAAALAAQDAAGREADKLARQLEVLRGKIAKLEPLVAESGRKIAALAARSGELEEQAAAAGRAADTGRERLVALAAEWGWSDVLARIEAKRDPRAALVDMRDASQKEADEFMQRLASIGWEERRIEQAIVKAAALRAEMREKRERSALYGELGRLLRADQFQAFVIEEAMQALADSASRHLATLYDRFAITADGGEFQVIDHWQADQVRPARTLSGGETFVASLALALALSERLPELRSKTAAVLESLFLDEGFGTLDPEVLEVVISALEGLRSEERMVGIITHVPELARRIESRIEVSKSPAGSTASVA